MQVFTVEVTFNTDRLDLRPISHQDETLLYTMFTDSYVRKYLWDDTEIPIEVVKDILDRNSDHFRNDGWGLWKVIDRQTDVVVGFVGLWFFFDERRPQLIYGLLEKYSGKGYASEAARRIAEYALKDLRFPFLIAACDAPNEKSLRVAESIGMEKIKEAVIDGKPTIIFRLQ